MCADMNRELCKYNLQAHGRHPVGFSFLYMSYLYIK